MWWKQAWDGWHGHELTGTGAGSFHLTNLRYRDTYLDFTTEPHDLPLQFLSEVGHRRARAVRRSVRVPAAPGAPAPRPRAGARADPSRVPPALAVDVDWDFVAVSAPAFLVAGALAGRPVVRRASAPAVLAGAGVAALAFGALLLPWLGARWANEALGAPAAHAVRLADRADWVDPLLVEAPWARADAAIELGQQQRAFDYYLQAVQRQPANPQTWLYAGEYALSSRCWRLAYTYLERYTELDPKARPETGATTSTAR